MQNAKIKMKNFKTYLLLTSMVLLSCNPPSAPESEFPNIYPDTAETDSFTSDAGEVLTGKLDPDGTWILYTETVSCISVLGIDMQGIAYSLEMVNLSDEGGGLITHNLLNCFIKQTPVLGLATVIPVALVESIPLRVFKGILDGTETGADYTAQKSAELWGVKLDDPLEDQMPLDSSDNRVYDMDNDEKPGATLIMGDNLCTLQVIQRDITQWEGQLISPVRIEGGGLSTSEQITLSASSTFCGTNYDVKYLNNQNRFILLRIDGKSGSVNLDYNGDNKISCEEVRTYGIEPFLPTPVDDSQCGAATK
jgi:hypothetical protein